MSYVRALLWLLIAVAGSVALLASVPRELVLATLPYAVLVGVALAAWVVIDAHRLELRQHETSMAWHPLLLFLLVAAWPIVVFPWYLTVRERVLLGQVPRKRPAPRSEIA